MRNILDIKLVLFSFSLALPSFALAQNWYLAPDGDDANNCLEMETPCKNIPVVVNKSEFVAGDKLLLQSGTYDLAGQTGIDGTSIGNALFEVYGGYNADYSKRAKLANKTILTSSAASSNGRLFAFNSGHEQPVVFDGVSFANFVQANATDIGLITTHTNGAWLKFNNVEFTGNKLQGAAAIELTVAGDSLEITNASFTHNQATGSVGGAICLRANTRGFIRDVIFSQNTAANNGGALYVEDAKADLVNVTFADNSSAAAGSALYASGSKTRINCTHCSFVSADTISTSYLMTLANSAVFNLKSSALAAENERTIQLLSGAQINDLGYNALGLNDLVGAAGVTLPAVGATGSYKNIEANLSDLFLSLVDYYGGLIPSLKPVSKNSSVIDKIPNDVPALQTGTLSSKPFTSLAQAHSALTSYAHYQKTNYQFKIDGQAFFTTVDKDGWVLVAGGDYTKASGAYEEAESITEKSDKILHRNILAAPGFIFDEVRITTRDAKPVALDVRSSNQTVITALKNFTTLPNNFSSNDGGWYAVQGAQYILATTLSGDNLTGLPNNGVNKPLNEIIYDGYGKTNTIKWMPVSGDGLHIEALHKDDLRNTDFNLWVRSSAAYCGGVVNTDQRGLPRPDYVNPNDLNQYGDVRDCDIGSFEWNNGYRLDCNDEDGERPENSITSSQVAFCIGDLSQITPKGIFDNLGAASCYYYGLLGLVFLWRRTNRVPASR